MPDIVFLIEMELLCVSWVNKGNNILVYHTVYKHIARIAIGTSCASLNLKSLFVIYKIYRKIILLRCLHHFKSDLINNMDHMCISGTEPSSVVLV